MDAGFKPSKRNPRTVPTFQSRVKRSPPTLLLEREEDHLIDNVGTVHLDEQ
jgi:hypothetical protein